MDYIKRIGARLETLLKEKGFTQKRLAVESKISRMTINGTIRGRVKKVSFETLIAICNVLNISLRGFFDSELFN